MSHWAKQFSRFGRDGYHLVRAVAQTRNAISGIKPVLLEQARQSNSVAHSLLKFDQHVGLVKYYGLSGYLKQRFQSTSAGDGGSSLVATSDSQPAPHPSTSTPSPSTGKVAFMVTASMKQDLQDLGYTADQTKSMTPLQASLILNESIPPQEMDEKLPLAEQAYEAQRQKEEAEQRERIELEQQQATKASWHTVEAAPSTSSSEYIEGSGSYASQNILDQPSSAIDGFGDEWYEVTETKKDGETSRVGLYQDFLEAELGLQTRQEISDRKSTDLVFEIHPISRDQL